MANEFKHKDPCSTLTQAEYIAACGDGHIFACQATGDIVYASSATVLSKLAKGAANTVLAMGGSCIPAWTASPSVTDLTIGGGCITLTGAATDIDLIDNNASALSFDASGKTGIIDIVTTNCSEGVTMSGTLGVTGVLTATGGIELGHASDTTIARSGSGAITVEGNQVYLAGGTDVPVTDGGTGASSLTDGGVLLGSGTSAVTAMAVLADSEMIVGDGTTDPVAESGATLRTSIGVGTGDSPQFTGIELSHATANTLTASSGVLSIEGNRVFHAGGTDVPVADGGTGASTFTANGILVGNGTSAVAVTATMATKGHVMIGDGSGVPTMLAVGSNCEVLTACSSEATGVKWAEAGGGAFTFVNGNTTEVTITGFSSVDILEVASLCIGATVPIDITFVAKRQASGHAARPVFGLEINCTVVQVAAGSNGANSYWCGQNGTAAADGGGSILLLPRQSGYVQGIIAHQINSATATGDNTSGGGPIIRPTWDANMPIATVTKIALQALSVCGSGDNPDPSADSMFVMSRAIA
jgi:hypothetical protein